MAHETGEVPERDAAETVVGEDRYSNLLRTVRRMRQRVAEQVGAYQTDLDHDYAYIMEHGIDAQYLWITRPSGTHMIALLPGKWEWARNIIGHMVDTHPTLEWTLLRPATGQWWTGIAPGRAREIAWQGCHTVQCPHCGTFGEGDGDCC